MHTYRRTRMDRTPASEYRRRLGGSPVREAFVSSPGITSSMRCFRNNQTGAIGREQGRSQTHAGLNTDPRYQVSGMDPWVQRTLEWPRAISGATCFLSRNRRTFLSRNHPWSDHLRQASRDSWPGGAHRGIGRWTRGGHVGPSVFFGRDTLGTH